MEIKIDTKEKFKVITPIIELFDDNIAKEFEELCLSFSNTEKKNLIINCKCLKILDENAKKVLENLTQIFYTNNLSFVVCECNEDITNSNKDWFEEINYAPTESEAWDIVQIEEIERELFKDEE